MTIVVSLYAASITPHVAERLNHLLGQVSRHGMSRLSAGTWRRIARQRNLRIFMIRERGIIVGICVLRWHELAGGKTAFLDDVVVDQVYRRRGFGTTLVKTVIEWAKAHDIVRIDFTSGPDRKAAHALYQGLGWEMRNTNVYRLTL